MTNYEQLTQLGNKVAIAESPESSVLEKVDNPHPETLYTVRFTCPEFTSLCPLTGQPDFAHLVIDYIPQLYLLESKSLKLYLASFRNHGAFHEACTIDIAKKIEGAVIPKWLRIAGLWYPRGGIPIDIFYQTASPPVDVWVPEAVSAQYRGRG